MLIFYDFVFGNFIVKIVFFFWEIVKFKKNKKCLDIGCGVSFLIYFWWDW